LAACRTPNKLPRSKLRGIKRKKHCLGAKQASGNRTLQGIEDDWIESVEKLEAMMDQYLHLRHRGRDVFELRYQDTIDPDKHHWELCSRVLARKDVVETLSESW
jgi:hypothetical protein